MYLVRTTIAYHFVIWKAGFWNLCREVTTYLFWLWSKSMLWCIWNMYT